MSRQQIDDTTCWECGEEKTLHKTVTVDGTFYICRDCLES